MRGRPALLGTNATKTQFRTLRRQVLLKSTPHLPNTTQRDIDVGDIILHTNTRMHALVSSLMFPPLCSPDTGTREVFMRGGRMGEERRAMKEKEGKWERGIVVCPHNAAPLFSEVTAGASRTPPPCLKAFFLSSSHPSLSPKESILCPLPSSPQNNRPLLWKKKKKLHSSAPISTCLSLMDPFPFEPVKSTSSLICCLFHIPSACGVGCMDGGNTRDWFCLQFDNLTAAAYTRMTMSEMQLSECLSLKQREDTWPYEPPWTGVVVVYSCDHAWCLFHFNRVSDDDCLRLHSDLSLQLRMTWYSSSYIKSFLLISAAPCGQKVVWHLFLWRPWFDLCKRNQKKQHTIFQILFYFFFKHCCFHGARLTG